MENNEKEQNSNINQETTNQKPSKNKTAVSDIVIYIAVALIIGLVAAATIIVPKIIENALTEGAKITDRKSVV